MRVKPPTQGTLKSWHCPLNIYRLKNLIIKDIGCGGGDEGKEMMKERR